MDGQTETCAHCGIPSSGGGRYCTNCGARLGTEPTNPRVLPIADDTAERGYEPPTTTYAPVASSPAASAPSYDAPPAAPVTTTPPPRGSGPGPGLWIGAVCVMVVVLLLGTFLLLRSGGGGSDSATPPIVPKTHHTPRSSPTSSSPTSASPSTTHVSGPPTNVAGFARVSTPSHAPAAVDFSGQPVSYEATNLVDGRNDTCWRTAGDATGMKITFTLDQPTRLSRVGLVNGYAKIAYSHGRPYDWYLGNRRVRSVDWIFDDGSEVSQTFGSSRTMQQTAIHPVTTRTVTLLITAVTPPGKGRASRNDTAISEVLLLGRTAG